MSLQRRARLTRRTPIARTRVTPTGRRRLDKPTPATGPTPYVRQLVWTRAAGRCELCRADLTSRPATGYSIHHRHPRRMGRTSKPWINSPANLLLLCGSGTTGCHGRVEAHRVVAYTYGWLLREGQHPNTVSVTLPAPVDDRTAHTATPVWLTAAGTYTDHPPRKA